MRKRPGNEAKAASFDTLLTDWEVLSLTEDRLSDAEQSRKDAIIAALRQHRRVPLAAKSLGVGERRLYRMMARFGLTLQGVLNWPSMPNSPALEVPVDTPHVPTEQNVPTADARRLSVADFSGPCFGDSRPAGNAPRSAEALQDRFRGLQGRRRYY